MLIRENIRRIGNKGREGYIEEGPYAGRGEISTSHRDGPPEFEYEQSSQMAYYFFYTVTIDGYGIDSNDWVGAFSPNGVCVGSFQWNTSLCGGGVCAVPVMGEAHHHETGELYEHTEGYMTPGDFPTFKIYDTSEDTYYDAVPFEDIPWVNMGYPLIDNLNSGVPWNPDEIPEPTADNYNDYLLYLNTGALSIQSNGTIYFPWYESINEYETTSFYSFWMTHSSYPEQCNPLLDPPFDCQTTFNGLPVHIEFPNVADWGMLSGTYFVDYIYFWQTSDGMPEPGCILIYNLPSYPELDLPPLTQWCIEADGTMNNLGDCTGNPVEVGYHNISIYGGLGTSIPGFDPNWQDNYVLPGYENCSELQQSVCPFNSPGDSLWDFYNCGDCVGMRKGGRVNPRRMNRGGGVGRRVRPAPRGGRDNTCVDDPNGTVATGPAGSCAQLVAWVGCDGFMGPGNDADVDCPVTCGTCPADCENEGPTSHGCCLTWSGVTYDGMLYINDSGKVFYNTLEGIGGFQFDVEGATLNGEDAASGGDAGSFTLSTNPDFGTVLGFTMTGNPIPPGCGTLVELDISGTPTGLSGLVISDANGQPLNFSYYGDFNEDGSVNVLDVTLLINTILYGCDGGECTGGIDVNEYPQHAHMDLTGDGIINILDVVTLIQMVLNDPQTTAAEKQQLQQQLSRLDGSGGRGSRR